MSFVTIEFPLHFFSTAVYFIAAPNARAKTKGGACVLGDKYLGLY